MKYIELGFEVTENMELKSVIFNHNDTGMKSDTELLEALAFTILKVIAKERDNFNLQDTLHELGISKPEKHETVNDEK